MFWKPVCYNAALVVLKEKTLDRKPCRYTCPFIYNLKKKKRSGEAKWCPIESIFTESGIYLGKDTLVQLKTFQLEKVIFTRSKTLSFGEE